MFKSKDISKALIEVREKSKKRKFNQSIDLAVNLNLNMEKPENRLNEEFMLPNSRGKTVRIGIIAEGELAHQAKKIADKVITREELEELAKDKKAAKKIVKSIDFFVAQADMMPLVGKHLGAILGPRGKMPKPVPVNASLGPVVERMRKTVRLRTKDKPVLQVVVGTEGMDDKLLLQNVEAVMHFLERKLEKGYSNIRSAYLKSTMGKSIKLEAS